MTTTHKQGCEALGGYGHGVGPCDCSAAPVAAQPVVRPELTHSPFPPRILALLQYVAERKPRPGQDVFEDEHGEPLQDDADAALAWIAAAAQPPEATDAEVALMVNRGPWRVGLFKSSSDPDKLVRMISEGAKEIVEHGRHKDFVRWLTPAQPEPTAGERA
jgi:hypothetical protein